MYRPLASIALALWLAMAQLADADEQLCDCEAECAKRADPLAGQVYEDETHRLWYEVRFWTGACHSDLWWCWKGPSWYDLMAHVLAKTKPTKQAALCPRLYRLGIRMGHEWARDNDIRRIHTEDLKTWRALLRDSPEPEPVLGQIEALVADRLK